MPEIQDVLDKLNDVLDKIADVKEQIDTKVAEIQAKLLSMDELKLECQQCHGTGTFPTPSGGIPCPHCGATGYIKYGKGF